MARESMFRLKQIILYCFQNILNITIFFFIHFKIIFSVQLIIMFQINDDQIKMFDFNVTFVNI